jgi:hypothetical protein
MLLASLRAHVAAAAVVTLAACAGSQSPSSMSTAPRPLASVPASMRFVPDTTFHPTGTTLSATACRTHLVDPKSGTRLTLVRSQGAEERRAASAAGVTTSAHPEGDFAVEPPTAYGLGTGDLLRVDCTTGEALGAVKR